MIIEDVYSSVHSHTIREPLRKFQPKYTLVIVSGDGVIRLEKYKRIPDFSEVGELLEIYEGCEAFFASANMYPTIEELEARIIEVMEEIKAL